MTGANDRREVVEQFTFRSGDKSIVLDAVIDTGATQTVISEAIAAALGLTALALEGTVRSEINCSDHKHLRERVLCEHG